MIAVVLSVCKYLTLEMIMDMEQISEESMKMTNVANFFVHISYLAFNLFCIYQLNVRNVPNFDI